MLLMGQWGGQICKNMHEVLLVRCPGLALRWLAMRGKVIVVQVIVVKFSPRLFHLPNKGWRLNVTSCLVALQD